MAFQRKGGSSFLPPKKSTTFKRGQHPFPKVRRAQPDNLTSEVGKEPAPGLPKTNFKAQAAQFITPKRTNDPGHGGTPSKVKKGFKKFPRKQAATTFPMKSFGGQI